MTSAQMYVFIGVFFLSEYAKYPHKRMFWSSLLDVPNNIQIDPIDRLFKLRPLITYLGHAFEFDHRSQHDTVLYKHFAIQYIKEKANQIWFYQ